MNLPISLAPRTLVSLVRTSIYGCLGAFLAVSNAEAKSVEDAMMIGGVMADFIGLAHERQRGLDGTHTAVSLYVWR